MKKKMKTSKKTTFSKPVKKRNKAGFKPPMMSAGGNNADVAMKKLRGY